MKSKNSSQPAAHLSARGAALGRNEKNIIPSIALQTGWRLLSLRVVQLKERERQHVLDCAPMLSAALNIKA